MIKPFYSRIKGKKIVLDRGILADLQMTLGSVLYAVELKNRHQSEWILSPIPPWIWNEAYELTVSLGQETGTLGEAAKILAKLDISVFASTVTPVSADGEVCWTAVALIPKDRSAEEITAALEESLSPLHPQTHNSSGPTDSRYFRLTPMHSLRYFSQSKQERFFSGKIEDFSLYLDKFRDEFDAPMLEHLSRYFMRSQRTGIPSFCLLSVDSEDKYLRMTFPPMRADLYQLSMDLRILSKEAENFRGIFAAVTTALGASDANIYASENYMLEKKHGGEEWTEEARFGFTIDLSNAKNHSHENVRSTEEDFYVQISRALQLVAAGRHILLPRDKFNIIRKDAHKPRCFLATNATKQDAAYHRHARKLIEMIRDLGLEVVNVDITKLPTVREDATNVLRSCAFLVSLHLPLPSVKTDPEAINADLGELGKGFAPSDWVMFEEAFMMAQGRRVFRLRHSEVRRPRYGVGEFDYPFEDDVKFEARLGRLQSLLSEYMTSADCQKCLQDCVAFVERLDIINFDRDLYAAYGLETVLDPQNGSEPSAAVVFGH